MIFFNSPRPFLLLATILVCFSFTSSGIEADVDEEFNGWKVLGRTTVKGGLDRDQIMVNAKKGTFRQLKIQVKNASLEMERLIVHFNKNEKQVVWLRKNFKKGSWSRVIQVKGGKRVIQKVVLWYSKKEPGSEKPVVFLWGRQ